MVVVIRYYGFFFVYVYCVLLEVGFLCFLFERGEFQFQFLVRIWLNFIWYFVVKEFMEWKYKYVVKGCWVNQGCQGKIEVVVG